MVTVTLFSLGMETISSFMPCSPEYSAEWVHFDVLLGETMGKEIECILGRLQKLFPVPGELRGTED